jgi:glycosyl transferase family 2
MTPAETFTLAAYFFVLIVLAIYGWHRYYLVYLYMRHRDKEPTAQPPLDPLPVVTIQLPLYNEMYVADRLIDAVSRIDYPRHLLEIQVLDDSTDETRSIADLAVRRLAAEGLDIKYYHRVDRVGFKAGALEAGLTVARGEFVAIFDADFIPTADFLTQLMPHFRDPKVGMVQARWGHINQDYSLLTKIQAILLDGHFVLEHGGRHRGGRFFNFNGTAGVWRRCAIEDAGGWQHDTLTEDLDLSYRAQLRGWQFIYRENVVTPAELPEDLSAFRAQQFRWAKGTVQTARKLMVHVMTAKLTFMQRVEAFFHLTPHFAYPLMVVLSVLLLPALIAMPATNPQTMLLIDLPLCVGTTGSLAAFYALAEQAQGRRKIQALIQLPALIALGAGLAPHLTKAVFEGMRSMAGEFVRTPKNGGNNRLRYRAAADLPLVEIALCLFSFASVVASIETGHWFATPFAMMFMGGYGYVAGLVVTEQASRRRAVAAMPVESESVPPSAPAEQAVEKLAA